MKKILFLILLTFIGYNSLAQHNAKLSLSDSLSILENWNKLIPYLTKESDNHYNLIIDTIYCGICITMEESLLKAKMHQRKFDSIGRTRFNLNKKIVSCLKQEEIRIGNSAWEDDLGNDFYIPFIGYTYWKPNEIKNGHEGAAVLFEFKKVNGVFKLYQISTIP